MTPFFKIEIIDHNNILLYEYIAQDQVNALQKFYKLKEDDEIIKKYNNCIMQLLQINDDQTYNIIKITNILNDPNQTIHHKSSNTRMILLIIIYILILPILLVKSAVKASK